MDLHHEFETFAQARATETGARLRGADVRARLGSRVARGRRARHAAMGAGTVAAVGLLAVGAVMVPRLGGGSVAPATSVVIVVSSTALPTLTLYGGESPDFNTVFALHGPEDGIVDEQYKISQEIPSQFACGAEWTLDSTHYLNQTIDRFAEFGDTLVPSGTTLDVTASDVDFVSKISTDMGAYYDTFVLLWVKDGVIVGNARVTQAYGPLIEGAAGERLSTVRGATALSVDTVTVPLTGPGACAVGVTPAGLVDGAYELHVIHEYGPSEVRVDGEGGGDPSVQIPLPLHGQVVEFISGDPYGAVVDPVGHARVLDVVGLGGSGG